MGQYNNRGFAHVKFFLIVRSILSTFVYGWMFYEHCCNKKCKKTRNDEDIRDREVPKDEDAILNEAQMRYYGFLLATVSGGLEFGMSLVEFRMIRTEN